MNIIITVYHSNIYGANKVTIHQKFDAKELLENDLLLGRLQTKEQVSKHVKVAQIDISYI